MRLNFSSRWEFRRLMIVLPVFLAVCLEGRSSTLEDGPSLTFVEANAGRVYAQAGAGRFVAIDAETGLVAWNFRDKNLRLFTKPAFALNGLFVAATGSNSHSELLRLDPATGRAEWRASIEGLGGNASPVLCGEEVLVSDYWHGTVFGYNATSGKNDWKTDSLPLLFLFPPAVLDDRAFFLAADKKDPEGKQELVSVSCRDGQPLKSLPVHIDGVSRTPVLFYKDAVVLSGYDKTRGTSLQAIRRSDGMQLWSTPIPDEITRFTPSIQDNLLVAGALSLWVLDLDTGKTIFHEALPTASVPIAVANGLVLLSHGNQAVEARDLPSGKLLRRNRGRETPSVSRLPRLTFAALRTSSTAHTRPNFETLVLKARYFNSHTLPCRVVPCFLIADKVFLDVEPYPGNLFLSVQKHNAD